MRILVIVPAYNEAENIVRVVSDLLTIDRCFDVLVVNDGSCDATVDLCRLQGYPFLNLPINLGLDGAMSAGMKYAYRHGYDAAFQFDADGQHRGEFIGPMVDKLTEGYDIVCGSRYLAKRRPFTFRMLGSRLITLTIRLTTGKELTDPTSGLRLYARRIIREFATQINHTPEPDTVSYLIRKGARVAEIPVVMDERIAGKSYFSAMTSVKYMLRTCLSILLVQQFRGSRFADAADAKQQGSMKAGG